MESFKRRPNWVQNCYILAMRPIGQGLLASLFDQGITISNGGKDHWKEKKFASDVAMTCG